MRILALLVALMTSRAIAATANPSITYRADRLSVRAEGVRLFDLLGAIETATGAEILGQPEHGDRLVTVEIEALPALEALRRILPSQPFSLRYRGDGTLRTIVLVGAATGRASEHASGASESAVTTLARPIAIDGLLAASVGASELPLDRVIDLAMRDGDEGVRGEAARATLSTLDADAGIRKAFLDWYQALSPELAARAADSSPGTEAFVRYLAANARSPELRSRAASIVAALGRGRK